MSQDRLPPKHIAEARALEDAYLRHWDPILQSGFHGGPGRWRSERGPILQAIDRDGDLLDVGCANGYLLECLVSWAAGLGFKLIPYGVDIGPRLIAEARRRMPAFASHFWVAEAWEWQPPRRFRYVYALADIVPFELVGRYARKLLEIWVEPRGRLIVGHYGSRSRRTRPWPVAELLRQEGLTIAGAAEGGYPPLTAFAWMDQLPT